MNTLPIGAGMWVARYTVKHYVVTCSGWQERPSPNAYYPAPYRYVNAQDVFAVLILEDICPYIIDDVYLLAVTNRVYDYIASVFARLTGAS